MRGTPQTAQTIAAAKAEQMAERILITKQTGVVFPEHPAPCLILCPRRGCKFVASARGEGRAVRALASHLIHHIQDGQ